MQVFFPEPTPVRDALDNIGQIDGYRTTVIRAKGWGLNNPASISSLEDSYSFMEQQLKQAGSDFYQRSILIMNTYSPWQDGRGRTRKNIGLIFYIPQECPLLDMPHLSKER